MKYLKTFILGGFVFSLILMAQDTEGVVTRDPGGEKLVTVHAEDAYFCLLYTSPSPRDARLSRMPSSA